MPAGYLIETDHAISEGVLPIVASPLDHRRVRHWTTIELTDSDKPSNKGSPSLARRASSVNKSRCITVFSCEIQECVVGNYYERFSAWLEQKGPHAAPGAPPSFGFAEGYHAKRPCCTAAARRGPEPDRGSETMLPSSLSLLPPGGAAKDIVSGNCDPVSRRFVPARYSTARGAA